MARLQLVAALLPLCALAYQAIPDKYANNAELRAVKWMGELANPFESFPEARWEKKESPLPHERMQFFGGDDDHEDPHVEAQFRSVPKYLLDEEATKGKSALEVAKLRAAIAKAEGDPLPQTMPSSVLDRFGAYADDNATNATETYTDTSSPTQSPTYVTGTRTPCLHKGNDDNPCNNMPDEFSWYAFHGKGLLTQNHNQHIPNYCGACWLFSGAAMLADRIKIARSATVTAIGPDIEMAHQTILNCAKRLSGTCANGTISGVFTYINEAQGVPFSSCENYQAVDFATCDPRSYCLSCVDKKECYGVPSKPSYDPKGYGYWTNGVPKIYIREWGYIGKLIGNSVRDLQIEIITRGPIACAVYPIPLQVYKKGVVDVSWNGELGHMLEVVGWGETDDGEKFWHVRNSWGEYWGERGFARIKRGVNAIGIESMCTWVVPTYWGTFAKSMGNNIDAQKNDTKGSTEHDWTDEESGKDSSSSGGDDDDAYDGDDISKKIDDAFKTDDAQFKAKKKSAKQIAEDDDDMVDVVGDAGFWEQDLVESLWKRGLPTDYTHPNARAAGFSGADEAARREALDMAVAMAAGYDSAAAMRADADAAATAAANAAQTASAARQADTKLGNDAKPEVSSASTSADQAARNAELALGGLELAAAETDAEGNAVDSPLVGRVITAGAAVGVVGGVAGFAGGRNFERRHGYEALPQSSGPPVA